MMSHTEGETLDFQQPAVSKGGSKVTAERVALLVLSAFLVAAVIVIYRVSMVNIQTKESLQMLKTKYDDVKRNLTETLSREMVPPSCPPPPEIKPSDSCLKCDEGWKEFGGKFYYFSNKTSYWEESRRYCQSCGGDLVKIDSEEEQRFLAKELSEKMTHPEDRFWIGLTDSKNESKWFWVDGSPLNTSLTFWGAYEPDDWKGNKGQFSPEGEDCVRMGEKGRPADLKCWSDRYCNVPQRSICEKQALNCTQ